MQSEDGERAYLTYIPRWKERCRRIIVALFKDKNAEWFRWPVRHPRYALDAGFIGRYYRLIESPMDLTTLVNELDRIESPQEFFDKMNLIFANCRIANPPERENEGILSYCNKLEQLWHKEWEEAKKEIMTDFRKNVLIRRPPDWGNIERAPKTPVDLLQVVKPTVVKATASRQSHQSQGNPSPQHQAKQRTQSQSSHPTQQQRQTQPQTQPVQGNRARHGGVAGPAGGTGAAHGMGLHGDDYGGAASASASASSAAAAARRSGYPPVPAYRQQHQQFQQYTAAPRVAPMLPVDIRNVPDLGGGAPYTNQSTNSSIYGELLNIVGRGGGGGLRPLPPLLLLLLRLLLLLLRLLLEGRGV